MKNTSYKNKQFVLLGMTFLSVAGIAGCSKVELAQSTVTLELGDELSENVADYLQDPDEKILKGASLDLSAVDETKVGSYNAAIAYDGKNYPFTVEVKDTTSPQCKAKDYIYMQPGTLIVDDLVTEIKDASETSSGIVSCERKDDLAACDYDDMLQKKAVVDTTDSYDEADYQESVQLDEEGCYEVTAQVKDSEGNFTDITLNVYVDGTAPELAQNVIDLDVDAYIPAEYIVNETQKLDIYKRIAGIETIKERDEMKDELLDRFGNIPKAVDNLLRIALIRMAAHGLDMTEIKGKNERITFNFRPDAKIDPRKIPDFLKKHKDELSFTAYGNPFFTYKYKKTGLVETDAELLMGRTEELLEEMKELVLETEPVQNN